ncbi:chemotaxis protein [Streptomyces sp. 150FB]|uniref:baeRF3 domain-containing protein n=1 Tax=Streptomyces sp. 150FB TaxID=1576605 RepID=UPI0005894A19|nr:hypothetical protein [Streptomyces sp. 150FB]KIF72981.1 chemotaxis protein [Streptomyces sp. 150FB]
MDSNATTPDLLRELRTRHTYPVVSLTMPTHRREPNSEQDGVRLRNVIAEAGRRLEADPEVPSVARIAVKEQLALAAGEVDPRRTLDGLLILADTEEFRVWYLPREVPERVVLSDTYVTRNLVAASEQSRPYWALGVAADHATLWSGTGESLHEYPENGFPMKPEAEAWDAEREERIGDTPSTFTDEETRRFLRSVDNAVGEVVAAKPRPLYVFGVAPALALLDDAGSAAHRAASGRLVKGGLTDGPAPVLLRELGPVVQEYARREKWDVLARLDDATSRHTFAGGLDEVWEAVREKRAALITLEEHYQVTARVSDGHLLPVGDGDGGAADWPDVREDIVDELVENALRGGAEVVFLPDSTLARHDRIAADLRY